MYTVAGYQIRPRSDTPAAIPPYYILQTHPRDRVRELDRGNQSRIYRSSARTICVTARACCPYILYTYTLYVGIRLLLPQDSHLAYTRQYYIRIRIMHRVVGSVQKFKAFSKTTKFQPLRKPCPSVPRRGNTYYNISGSNYCYVADVYAFFEFFFFIKFKLFRSRVKMRFST